MDSGILNDLVPTHQNEKHIELQFTTSQWDDFWQLLRSGAALTDYQHQCYCNRLVGQWKRLVDKLVPVVAQSGRSSAEDVTSSAS